MVNGEAGKGSGIRKGFDWKQYGKQYEKIFNPRCYVCGSIMKQRAGWYNIFMCDNKQCENYSKLIRKE